MIAHARSIEQLDLFAPPPPEEFYELTTDGRVNDAGVIIEGMLLRTWRDSRNVWARIKVARHGRRYCFGLDLMTPTSGQFFGPSLRSNSFCGYKEAITASMDYLISACQKEAAKSPAHRKLLRLIEIGQYEEGSA